MDTHGIILVGSIFTIIIWLAGAPLWVAWLVFAGAFAVAFLDERLGK
jgi:hypothetical protein